MRTKFNIILARESSSLESDNAETDILIMFEYEKLQDNVKGIMDII